MGGGNSKATDEKRTASLVYQTGGAGEEKLDSGKKGSYRRKTFSLSADGEVESANNLTSRNMRSTKTKCDTKYKECWNSEAVPEGDTFITIGEPTSDRCLRVGYATHSQAGTSKGSPKTNQDAFTCLYPLESNGKYLFAGVYDGHGMNGELISNFVAKDLPKMVKKYMDRRERKGWTIEQALQKAHEDTDLNLKFEAQTCNWRLDIAGSTAISILVMDGNMYVCKVGDSRCVIGFKGADDKLDGDQCLEDHSPDNTSEAERIENSGGAVSQFHDRGPKRIWLKGFENVKPGLAVTRSFGDLMAESVGVFAVPEIKCLDLLEDEVEMIAVMSDGVFEHIPNKEVVAYMSSSSEIFSGCKTLVAESARRWEERIGHCDDITIVAMYVKPNVEMTDEEKEVHDAKVSSPPAQLE